MWLSPDTLEQNRCSLLISAHPCNAEQLLNVWQRQVVTLDLRAYVEWRIILIHQNLGAERSREEKCHPRLDGIWPVLRSCIERTNLPIEGVSHPIIDNG